MHLSPHNPTYKEQFSKEYWLNLYKEKYNFQDFPPGYFEYIDTSVFLDIGKKEQENIDDIVRSVNSIFRKAYAHYYKELEKNLPAFSRYISLFRESYPYDEHFIARYDILVDEFGVLQFLETNANTPGMICESHIPAEILTPEGYENNGGKLIQYTKEWWQQRKKQYGWKKLAICTAYLHENEDYFVCRTYAAILEEVWGKENIIIGDIYDMNIIEDTTITMKGEKIDAILSYFPIEFFLTDPGFADTFLSIISCGGCALANPLESMVFQDKLIFAVVWEHIDTYTSEEKRLIQKHIPYTTRVFQEDSSIYLAKWRFGRYGREIYTQDFYTHISEQDRYIYQKKVIPRKEDALGSYFVLSAYTNLREPISWITRKQEYRTTDDTYNMVTLVYNPL